MLRPEIRFPTNSHRAPIRTMKKLAMRRLITLMIAVATASTVAQSQSFEVVTVKKAEIVPRPPFALGCRGVDAGPTVIPQGRCRYTGLSLRALIVVAYQV